MSSAASPAPMMNRSNFQRPSPIGGGMELGNRQMPQPPAPSPFMRGRNLLGPLAARPQQNFVPVQTMIQQAQQPQINQDIFQQYQPFAEDLRQRQQAFNTENADLLAKVNDLGSKMYSNQQVLQPQQPMMPSPMGAQPQGKMGGGYPAASNPPMTSPVSGDPGMAGGGMTPTTQPVGVSVPVDVQPFIAGRGDFMGGGSYGAPARGSDTMPEDYANLYGGRFGRGR